MGEILPAVGVPSSYNPVVHRLSRAKKVYLLVERNSGTEAVAKVYQGSHALEVRDREFANLKTLVDLGFCEGSQRVVCPYTTLNKPVALFMERAKGRDLDHYIKWAIRRGREEKLKQKLSLLAGWFAKLHTNSAQNSLVSGKKGYKYLAKVVLRLKEAEVISPQDYQGFLLAAEEELNLISEQDRKVFVHGDATPTNLFFRGEIVTAIDLERAKSTHRCWDLGFVGGELIHHFKWRGNLAEKGREMFRLFLQRYSEEAGCEYSFLQEQLSLYLAMGLLRIARNPWLDLEHRRWLIKEAKAVLKMA